MITYFPPNPHMHLFGLIIEAACSIKLSYLVEEANEGVAEGNTSKESILPTLVILNHCLLHESAISHEQQITL